ncbi:arrestin domain-containing protein 3-like [Mya arenaria]|uniref:arrestin domain-containing protein 3-like n=1 Tax=Mya arenaria TaxID=6604 RepID=UPI0022DF54D7|nr:arrestin domain-containing protein 3-like [Mya arenaria]
MGKRTLAVHIDNLKQVYFPGDQVSGRVVLEISEELKVRKIELLFHGFADVHWTERRQTKNGSHTVHYRNHEDYFVQHFPLFGKDQTGEDKTVMAPNVYTFPFTAVIPYNIPSSYEAHIGQVRYMFKANVDRPWAFDMHAKHMITVMDALDLNTIPNLESRAEKTDQKVLCCLCCASDPISAHVRVERQGYVAGEEVQFWAEINNQSNRTMTCSKGSLLMSVSYHARSKTRTVGNVLGELRHGAIEGGGTDAFVGERLHIPAVPPSFLRGCRIIDIRYFVNVTVDPSGLGFDLHVPVEIVIGSIPLRNIAQQHGFALPPAQQPIQDLQPRPEMPPPYVGAPKGLYSDTVMPSAVPNTVFTQSALGAVSTAEEGDNEHTYGNTNYAPVYTYYNWSTHDTNRQGQLQIEGQHL